MNLIYIFLLIFLYSFLGYIVEMIFCLIVDKELTNRGYLIGPLCPIYGIGATLIYLLLNNLKEHPIIIFFLSMCICFIVEYLASFLLEKIFYKNKWWDYSNMKFNINGRVYIPYCIAFGIFGVLVVSVINPLFTKLINYFHNYLNLISLIILILFIIDFTYSTYINLNLKKYLKNKNIPKDLKNYLKNHKTTTKLYTRIIKSFSNLKTSYKNILKILTSIRK
ncbi:MAG: putative ABC transporter permease [bacterium]|nr:putative ABC transporter permease [bacterium]